MGTTRRVVIGGAGALVLAGAGLGYPTWDRGVFTVGEGEAFEPWQNWRGNPADGPKQTLNPAILAANPHDTQPWLFQAAGESITMFADRSRNLGSFDPFRREMHLGVGCAIENLMRAASVFGWSMNVIINGGKLTPSPKNDPVRAAHLWLDAAPASRDPLFEAIPHRHTNRGRYLDKPVSEKTLLQLIALISDHDVQLAFITDAHARKDLAATIVSATEHIIADPEMSKDSAHWFRTGRREVDAHRDGIGIDTAGLSRAMAAGAKLMPDQDAATADKYWLGMTRDIQTIAPVLGIIMVRDRFDMANAIAAGRAWQRLHLAATSMGLAAQPLNQPVECVDRAAQLGKSDAFGKTLKQFAKSQDYEATFCFRLGYAEREALPSARRPLSAVMMSNA